eukprot:4542396-Amphidinium_carterae.1
MGNWFSVVLGLTGEPSTWSCGAICGKELACGVHTCPLRFFCRGQSKAPRKGMSVCHTPFAQCSCLGRVELPYSVSYGQSAFTERACDGNHLSSRCHSGPCPPCASTTKQYCYCGAEKQDNGSRVHVTANELVLTSRIDATSCWTAASTGVNGCAILVLVAHVNVIRSTKVVRLTYLTLKRMLPVPQTSLPMSLIWMRGSRTAGVDGVWWFCKYGLAFVRLFSRCAR